VSAQPGKVVAIRRSPVPARTRPDREFLPAALEILETPASPIKQTLLWLICGMFAAVLAWSWFAKLDINAVAPGRIQTSGRSKIIQPLEPGKVKAIFAMNGAVVKEGDLLIELDSTETQAELDAQTRLVEALNGEIARRRRAIHIAMGETQDTAIPFPADVGDSIRVREINVMNAELAQLTTTREGLIAQIDEREATKRRLAMSIAARRELIKSLRERVDMRSELFSKSAGTRAAMLDALQTLQTEETNLAFDNGQLIESEASIRTLRRKVEQTSAEFVADQTDKLNEAEQRRDRAVEDKVKAAAKNDRTRLAAPISGTLQQLAVTSVGQVVNSGQPLLVVVPNGVPLEIEAMVLNGDIGFIELGQEAVVKIDSFPFTRYGVMHGTVTRLSRDAVSDKEAQGASDSISVGQGQSLPPVTGTQKIQNLVFPVTIGLDRNTFDVDGKEVPLTPGMTVSVEIRTGERRAIDYILSPLRETVSQAGRER
jgi:membrane fusion protein, hemolysin D